MIRRSRRSARTHAHLLALALTMSHTDIHPQHPRQLTHIHARVHTYTLTLTPPTHLTHSPKITYARVPEHSPTRAPLTGSLRTTTHLGSRARRGSGIHGDSHKARGSGRRSGRVRVGEAGVDAATGKRRVGAKGGIAGTLTRGEYLTMIGAHRARGAKGYLHVVGERAGGFGNVVPGAPGRVVGHVVKGRPFLGGARAL